jgi:hypothetical protein
MNKSIDKKICQIYEEKKWKEEKKLSKNKGF